MNIYYLIDPPEGHKYGFPKKMSKEDYENQHLKSLTQWCIDNGYPKEVVYEYDDCFFVRVVGPIVDPKLQKAFEEFACLVFDRWYENNGKLSLKEISKNLSEEWIKNHL